MVKLLRALKGMRERIALAGAGRLNTSGSPLAPHEAEYLLRTVLTSYLVALGHGQCEPFAQAMAELAEREAAGGHPRRAEAVVLAFDLLHDLADEIGPAAEFGPADAAAARVNDVLDAGRAAFFGTWFRAKAEEDERRDQAMAALAEAAGEVPTIVYSTDADGMLTDISHQAAELLGYAKEDLLGRHFSVLMLPEDAKRFGHFIAERRTAGRATRRSKVNLTAADGTVSTFELSATGVYGRDGDYLGSDGAARPAENQLPTLQYQLDKAGHILHISSATASALGYQPEELLGRHFSVLMDERERARVGRLFGERRRDRRSANGIRVVLTGADGAQREFEISAVGRYDDEGEFAGTLGLGSDVTQHAAREEHLADQRRRASAVFDALGVGLLVVELGYVIAEANAVHEASARRPLAGATCYRAVYGRSEPCPWCRLDAIMAGEAEVVAQVIVHPLDGREYALRCAPLPGERGAPVAMIEMLTDIADERQRQTALFEAERRAILRRWTAAVSGEQQVATGTASPNAAVRRLLAEVDLSGGLTVEDDLCPLAATVAVPEDTLRGMLAALVDNAMEAMPDGGALTIETVSDGATGVLLRVSDTGDGLTPDVLQQAFEPGFTTKPGHAGLGLARVDHLADRYGGWLALSGEPGAGSVAELWLPVVPGDEA
ncbi:MAG: PAS domain S-box protein [Armatimonadetes bacterium]|nr:PAS domain S-box protein [Armatimonadota bacterium]